MADTIRHSNTPPEILVYKLIDSILDYLQENIRDNALEPKKMVLYDILSDMNLKKHNYFEEGKELFSRNRDEHERAVDIRQFFDAARAKDPTIHITLSSDNQGGDNSIGLSTDEFVYEEDYTFDDVEGTRTADVSGRSFETSLQLVFTSSNHHEVMVMYYVIRALLISTFSSLELEGFQNIKFSGRELQINETLAPNLYSRGLSLSGFYEVRVRDHNMVNRIKEFFIEKSTPYLTGETEIK